MLQQIARMMIGAAASAAVMAALTSCAGQAHSEPVPTPTPEQTETGDPTAPTSTTGAAAQPDTGNQGLLKAGETAQAAVPGGTVVSLDYEYETPWGVEVVTAGGAEHRVEVSRDGTTIVAGPTTGGDATAGENAERQRRVEAAKIDFRQAAAKATQVLPGKIKKLSLENREGSVVWAAQVYGSDDTRHRVVIDAASGDVVPQN